MPRDRHVMRALELQRDPALPPTLELDPGPCPILRADGAMKERLERREAPPPPCRAGCPVRAFFDAARAAGARVELDVGAGYGRFARAHAAANPDVRLLAIEQEGARVARSDVLSRRAGQTNLAYLVGEARYALEFCVPPESVDAVYVLFPDPWPKDRHARNRFFRAPNIELVRRLLRPGGVLRAATDNEAYFAQMRAVLGADARFEPVAAPPRPEAERTDFERKFLGQGKAIREAAWRKRPAPGGPARPVTGNADR